MNKQSLVAKLCFVDHTQHTIKIEWNDVDFGFGNIYIFEEDGILKIDSEFMEKDFVKEVLSHIVDQAVLDLD